MIDIAHFDPPVLPEPGKASFIVNHRAVQHGICYLLDKKCDPNVEYTDPETGRYETPLRYTATLASQHTKGAIVTVMNMLVQYDTYLFSSEHTGQYADPSKRIQEHEEIAERERQYRIAHAAGDHSKKKGGNA